MALSFLGPSKTVLSASLTGMKDGSNCCHVSYQVYTGGAENVVGFVELVLTFGRNVLLLSSW
jgi:hypothetical protein